MFSEPEYEYQFKSIFPPSQRSSATLPRSLGQVQLVIVIMIFTIMTIMMVIIIIIIMFRRDLLTQ